MINFGTIRDNVYDFLAESIANKDSEGQKLYKEYINTIKNSKILKAEMAIYENLENKYINSESSAGRYLGENIAIMKSFSKEDILKEHSDLESILSKYGISFESANTLHNSINTLLISERTANSINTIHESFEVVKSHLMEVKKVEDEIEFPSEMGLSGDLPSSVLANLAVNRFNTKYMGMSEGDKEILKIVTGTDNEAKETLMNTLKEGLTSIIDSKVETMEDGSTKAKLVKAKAMVNEFTYTADQFMEDVVKLQNLKKGLS